MLEAREHEAGAVVDGREAARKAGIWRRVEVDIQEAGWRSAGRRWSRRSRPHVGDFGQRKCGDCGNSLAFFSQFLTSTAALERRLWRTGYAIAEVPNIIPTT